MTDPVRRVFIVCLCPLRDVFCAIPLFIALCDAPKYRHSLSGCYIGVDDKKSPPLPIRKCYDTVSNVMSKSPSAERHSLRLFLARLWPYPLAVSRKHVMLAGLGAGIGLVLTSLLSHWMLGELNLWFVAPVGASAVLLFGLPASPLAQPWAIVGGNSLSALAGVTVSQLIPDPAIACGVQKRLRSAVSLAAETCLLLTRPVLPARSAWPNDTQS